MMRIVLKLGGINVGIMFTVEFPLQDGKQSDLLALLAEALPDTRAFDGCISVETYAEQDASSQFCSLASA